MSTPTPAALVVVVYPVSAGRYSWRLEAVRGHGWVVDSGTSYLTRASAKAGARRFLRTYVRSDAPITMEIL